MNDLFELSFTGTVNAAITETVNVVFDGGTPCNIPSRGYGIGYGSYKVNNLAITRLSHGKPMSANTAEILTVCAALEWVASTRNSKACKAVVTGDSQVALKWVRLGRYPATKKKGLISKGSSPEFREAIHRLTRIASQFGAIETVWKGRANSVALFGH